MIGFSPRWRKVLRDLASSKTRTALVVLSIAVGVFAIGVVTGSRQMIREGMSTGYLASNPPSASLFTDELFDDDLVQAVKRMDGVADAEARRSVGVKIWRQGEWKEMDLLALPDYDDSRIARVSSERGVWPPAAQEVLLEQKTVEWLGADVGDTIKVKTIADSKERLLTVSGVVHNSNLCPPFFCQRGNAMIALDTVEWLGEEREFNQMNIVVAENGRDKEHIKAITRQVQDKIEKSGRTVTGTDVPEPGKHPIADVVDTLILLLGVLGFFSLLLSGFLVINTIGALLSQQTRQIGVMKSIGATSGNIVAMYLVTVLIYGGLSLFVAVPLGALGARLFADWNASLFNFQIVDYGVPPLVLGLQALTGLLVPVLAALVPVFMGTRITVREAISGYGLGKGRFGKSWIDRALERVRGVSRPLLLSLRNTFRRKARLGLTLTTLTLAGAIFIAVLSVRASVALTLQDIFAYYNSDVFVITNKPYRNAVLAQIEDIPGVQRVEGWGFYNSRRQRPDDSESNLINIISLPVDTEVFNYHLVQGRWLLPGDQNAVVVNTKLLDEEDDIRVGSPIKLKVNGKELTFTVVGAIQMLLDQPAVYTSRDYFNREIGDIDKAVFVNVVLDDPTAENQVRIKQAVEALSERRGLELSQVLTSAENSAQAQSQFDIIIVLMAVMAVLLAIVGGLGLMGTMSINVIERTREIGVMRAIGASDGAVLRIVMVEGMLVGIISWCLGALIAVPISKLLSDAVGIAFIQEPFSYTFSLSGLLIWLGVVLGLAALASFLPAWNASRLTVRDVLAYE